MESKCIFELKDITKRFGRVVANNSMNLTIAGGEILCLLGENGSGKTTLMNMLSGIYMPDEGHILKNGEEIRIRSPHDAFTHGIGMIHQHFKLVDVLTVAENIVLGLDENGPLDRRLICQRVSEICAHYGFELDPTRKVYDLSVSQKQTVEIVKVLYRGAELLILDEPTAVLTPQETARLFDVLRNMRADGKAIVLITHKLNEVKEISDKVAVLRKGNYIGTVETASVTAQELTDMMVGHSVSLNISRPLYPAPEKRLEVQHLTVLDRDGIKKLDDVSFHAMAGEILGIAGIAGSGQKELLEAIAGLLPSQPGSSIQYLEDDITPVELTGLPPRKIIDHGVLLSFVPEDRFGMGLVGSMSIVDNIILRSYRQNPGPFPDLVLPQKLADNLVDTLEVVTPDTNRTPLRRLSGGNVQKVLVGREIAFTPSILMSAYAVRGLDINTSYTIYNLLTEQKMKGVAVIYVGEDLDVLLELCDRILVLCGGQVSGVVDARTATKEQIGRLMTQKGEEVDS